MKIDIVNKVCSTCPWLKENAYQLEVNSIKNMIEKDIISPCHQELQLVTGDPQNGVEIYADKMIKENKPFMMCKGMCKARTKLDKKTIHPLIKYMYMLSNGLEDEDNLVDMEYIYGKR